MKLSLLVCGKLKPAAETDLVMDYLQRAKSAGRALGFADVFLREVVQKPSHDAQKTSDAAFELLAARPGSVIKIILDERGRDISSMDFARFLGGWHDQGIAEASLMVGPADGWSAKARGRADIVLGFGKWTWPHRLAQVMAAEQLYRGTSILAGAPYHREGAKR